MPSLIRSPAGGPAVRERRIDAGEQAHRAQVDVLIELLAQRKDQLPHRDVIGHRRIADGAEVDGGKFGETLERIGGHHAAVLGVIAAAVWKLDQIEIEARTRRDLLENRDSRGKNFLTDTIAGNHRNAVRGHEASVS